MPRDVNKLILVGQVEDPPACQDVGEILVARFELVERSGAVRYRHQVEAVDKLATFARDYLQEPSRLYLEGKLCLSDEGPVVIAKELVLLSPKRIVKTEP